MSRRKTLTSFLQKTSADVFQVLAEDIDDPEVVAILRHHVLVGVRLALCGVKETTHEDCVIDMEDVGRALEWTNREES